jgi:DNA-directed RNA polymerase beta subunit
MCEDLYKNQFEAELARMERKWEFRYERQLKKQRELEETITKLRKQIKELKK